VKVTRYQLAIALLLIAVGVSLRLLPHPANVAPITAIAIFGGSVLPRRLGAWVPVGAMMLSDMFIGFFSTTWGCYLFIALVSSYWLRKLSLYRGIVLTLASSLFFFVVTNFAVWVTSGMYTHTWRGILQCYSMALPFFRNTVISDLIYTVALFSLYGFACAGTSKLLKLATQKA
jgi:hypothetical protein